MTFSTGEMSVEKISLSISMKVCGRTGYRVALILQSDELSTAIRASAVGFDILLRKVNGNSIQPLVLGACITQRV